MMDAGEEAVPSFVERVSSQLQRKQQILLDKSTVYIRSRWAFFAGLMLIYGLRVYLVNGWYIVTYGLGIYLLNLFIGFLSPQIDPETDGLLLPQKNSEEFRPFSRRVPEFKFWLSSTKATAVAFVMTFFRVFDIPVFWPILLLYFTALFVLTMKMIKHKYVPFSWGKTTYVQKDAI